MRRLGCLAALAVSALIACKGKDATPSAVDQGKRCDQLAKTCGDTEKHVAKLAEECKAVKPACADKAAAAYACYETELCGKADKVWALDDLGVLADRHKKCVAERDAVRDCVAKP